MNIYRKAGRTLAMAVFYDRQQRALERAGNLSHPLTQFECEMCKCGMRNDMYRAIGMGTGAADNIEHVRMRRRARARRLIQLYPEELKAQKP